MNQKFVRFNLIFNKIAGGFFRILATVGVITWLFKLSGFEEWWFLKWEDIKPDTITALFMLVIAFVMDVYWKSYLLEQETENDNPNN